MGVANHEIEPVDEHEAWCDIHHQYYRIGLCCGQCLEIACDMTLQDLLDEKGRKP